MQGEEPVSGFTVEASSLDGTTHFPIDARFEADLAFRKQQGEAAYTIPENFLADLRFMPPAAGNALGIDRLELEGTPLDGTGGRITLSSALLATWSYLAVLVPSGARA